MGFRFDEKGKFFTDVVSKRTIPAVIQTISHCIHGNVYIRKNERLSDEINRAEQFMAITDAEIYDLQGQHIASNKFMAVNRSHIVWLYPKQEDQEDVQPEEGLGGPE